MPRPKNCRRVHCEPVHALFKPAGIPSYALECVSLGADEFEAIRLADLEGAYHGEGAQRMNVSRQTFGRILQGARKKVARVLVNGLALQIEGNTLEAAQRAGSVRRVQDRSQFASAVPPESPAE